MPDDDSATSIERPRRTEPLGYVAPCRCAATHHESGHRHECIAGQGHAGWHRCYCGGWFQAQGEGQTMAQQIGERI